MESPYKNVPIDMLYCHMCMKHMCDAVSFEHHLNDPNHLRKLNIYQYSYCQTACLMRHDFKIADFLILTEGDPMKPKVYPDYCTTCHLKIIGPVTIHEESEYHLLQRSFMLSKTKEAEEGKEIKGKEINESMSLPSTSVKNDDKTMNAKGLLNEPQEEEEQTFPFVPTQYRKKDANDAFYCYLCKIHVRDKFEKHLINNIHVMVRECLEDNFRPMENNYRMQKAIAYAMGRRGQPHYCLMCDMIFHGPFADHRDSQSHVQMKKFFYSTCAECDVEFDSPIDYDTHLLTAGHMIKIAEKNARNSEVQLQITLEVVNADEKVNDVKTPTKRKREDDDDDEEADETKNGEKLSPNGKEEDETTYDSDDSILYIDEGHNIGADIGNCLPEFNGSYQASPA